MQTQRTKKVASTITKWGDNGIVTTTPDFGGSHVQEWGDKNSSNAKRYQVIQHFQLNFQNGNSAATISINVGDIMYGEPIVLQSIADAQTGKTVGIPSLMVGIPDPLNLGGNGVFYPPMSYLKPADIAPNRISSDTQQAAHPLLRQLGV